jgi:hypothetical protein
MTDSARIEQAWQSLWRDGELQPPAGSTEDALHLHVADLDAVPLFKSEAYGVVALSLEGIGLVHGTVARAESIAHDPQSGTFRVELGLPELVYMGHYVATQANVGGAAAAAHATLGDIAVLTVGDDGSQAQTTGDQAKAYRTKLLSQDPQKSSGPQLVQSYYDHNPTYAELFQLSSIRIQWTTHTTDGQNSAYYATFTANAAQSPDAPLNGQPDGQGYSPYNGHAFWQQNMVMNGCYAAQSHYEQTGDTDKAKRYGAAGDAASQFSNGAQQPSKSAQTVNSVVNLTAATAPSTAIAMANAIVQSEEPLPEWRAEILRAGARTHRAVLAELQALGDDTGKSAALSSGTFSALLSDSVVSLEGRLDSQGQVSFTRATAVVSKPSLALGSGQASSGSRAASTQLGRQLDAAVARTPMLADLLRERAKLALEGETLKMTLGQWMTTALQQAQAQS